MIICVKRNQYTCNSNGLNRVNEEFESAPFTKNFQQTSVATSSELDAWKSNTKNRLSLSPMSFRVLLEGPRTLARRVLDQYLGKSWPILVQKKNLNTYSD